MRGVPRCCEPHEHGLLGFVKSTPKAHTLDRLVRTNTFEPRASTHTDLRSRRYPQEFADFTALKRKDFSEFRSRILLLAWTREIGVRSESERARARAARVPRAQSSDQGEQTQTRGPICFITTESCSQKTRYAHHDTPSGHLRRHSEPHPPAPPARTLQRPSAASRVPQRLRAPTHQRPAAPCALHGFHHPLHVHCQSSQSHLAEAALAQASMVLAQTRRRW